MIFSEVEIQKHRCLVLDPPVVPPGAPVIATLHGLGTNGEDLAALAQAFHLEGCRFVLPDAPLRLPGYPPGALAWYDFQAPERKQFLDSREYLFKVFDRFANDPNLRPAPGQAKKQSPLAVIGFSQGGVMSLEAGLNYKGKLSAIVSMSGYMPDAWQTLTRAEAPFDTPILLVHGTEDEVVPVEGSRKACQALKEAGYSPVLREFPMGHQITEASYKAVKEFLKEALKV
ncbi:MAG TPA: alpha/beta fold hydrolase [bacterium]|nr:alpha/beta fold hydrolase [bacterium]